MPVDMSRVVPLAKVDLGVVAVLLQPVLPVVIPVFIRENC
jgi:hypothetical protein